jgi:uncharacterized membrane protein
VITSALVQIVASVALAILGLPLALKLVPPNRVYGFATDALANRALWFRVNRFAGWSLVVAGAVSAFIFMQFPDGALGAPAYEIGVFVVPLLIALVATGIYVKSASAHPA